MHLGSWDIDDFITFAANVHDPTDGSAADADSAPTYRIYEDETGTPIVTGTMALLDDAGTLGFYSERVQLTAGSGFERGKTYTIYLTAAVGGVTGTWHHSLQVREAPSVAGDANAALVANNLDHLALTATAAADMTTEVADNTILSRMLSAGDTSAFDPATDGLQLIRDAIAAILMDTGTTLPALLPAALVGGRIDANVGALSGGATAADKLEASAATMVVGTVDNTAFSPTTTIFEADDITTAAADHYIGRVVIFTSGTLQNQASVITDYELNGGRGRFTVQTLTSAPANDVTFIIV